MDRGSFLRCSLAVQYFLHQNIKTYFQGGLILSADLFQVASLDAGCALDIFLSESFGALSGSRVNVFVQVS